MSEKYDNADWAGQIIGAVFQWVFFILAGVWIVCRVMPKPPGRWGPPDARAPVASCCRAHMVSAGDGPQSRPIDLDQKAAREFGRS